MHTINRKDQLNAAAASIRESECPFCKSHDFAEGHSGMGNGEVYINYHCEVCEQHWTVWYSLILDNISMENAPVYGAVGEVNRFDREWPQ